MFSVHFPGLLPLFYLLPQASPYPTQLYPSLQKSNWQWQSTKSLITFGDSYTYVQGTLGYANYTFIGDLQHLSFTPSDLFSSSIVQNQTGTAEGGPNWVQYLTG